MTKVKLLIGSLDIMDQNCKKVPECLYYCPDSPLPNKTENLEGIWDETHWSDTVPIFSCTNSKLLIFN